VKCIAGRHARILFWFFLQGKELILEALGVCVFVMSDADGRYGYIWLIGVSIHVLLYPFSSPVYLHSFSRPHPPSYFQYLSENLPLDDLWSRLN